MPEKVAVHKGVNMDRGSCVIYSMNLYSQSKGESEIRCTDPFLQTVDPVTVQVRVCMCVVSAVVYIAGLHNNESTCFFL